MPVSDQQASGLRLAASQAHEALPVRGTVKREKDREPVDLLAKAWDYPILADCAGCEMAIRKENAMFADWEHTGMTAAAGMKAAAVIKAWANHSSMTRQLAARLARELALRPACTLVDSSMKIAARYGVSHTMAVNARYLLAGAKLIHKKGRRYYTGQPRSQTANSHPYDGNGSANDRGSGNDGV